MNSLKPQIFNYFTKIQKSDICHYIASFVKKDFDKTTENLIEKFIENEKYYLEINSTRFSFLSEFISEPEFLQHLELYIKECQKKYEYNEKQKPLYEKQKAYLKEQRKKAREYKMKREPATKAQISFYKQLCKKFKVEKPLDVENTSKLEIRDVISQLLQEP